MVVPEAQKEKWFNPFIFPENNKTTYKGFGELMYNNSTAASGSPPPLDRTQAAVEGASRTQVGSPATTFDTGLLAPAAFTALMAKKNS
jgi:hypothetical protein